MSNLFSSLTASQRAHLGMLHVAGAHSRRTAVSIFCHPAVRDLVPNVVGILRAKHLADSRVATVHGSRRTVYWLTEAGVAKAQELAT
jgi:hypothetical protein